jgi:ubiquitin-protein ligase E3 C
MTPLFGSEDLSRKRNINLGGSSSSASQSALLEQAKARRNQRDSERRRQDAAIRVQAWWRGQAEGKRVREALKHIIREDPHGTRGLRALVLAGRDEQALSFWSSAMTNPGVYYP